MLAGYVAVENVDEAKSIFDTMPKRNVIASNSMIVLFGKSRNVDDARKVFDEMADRDMVSWSALISCYLQNEMYEEALKKFKEMTFDGVMVDEIVLISALSASAHSLDVNTGRLIHSLAIKVGIDLYVNLQNALIHMYSVCSELVSAEKLFSYGCCLDLISWNSMISGYLKCREINKARSLFNSMPRKDIVSWSVMISGYAQLDRFADALTLFQDMFQDGIQPDETVLNAMEVFDQMEEKGVSSWNALILGLAMNGLVKESLETFSEMEERGIVANEVTFLAVLGACRHVGLVEEGRGLFELMTEKYKIEPSVKHYGCMVDLLGRAGKLREAEELIATMPMAPDVSTWGALLGACNKHEDDAMGERVGRKLIGLRPEHDGFHVMLSNIYASRGDWDGVNGVRGTMRKNKVTKVPGCSMIEVNGIVHEFFAGENRQHPQIDEIDEMLEEMGNRLKMEGYAADKDNEESEDMQ
ncbi:Pentatricopeptide repeat-containing protein At5g06540 [Linum grandiflorum]